MGNLRDARTQSRRYDQLRGGMQDFRATPTPKRGGGMGGRLYRGLTGGNRPTQRPMPTMRSGTPRNNRKHRAGKIALKGVAVMIQSLENIRAAKLLQEQAIREKNEQMKADAEKMLKDNMKTLAPMLKDAMAGAGGMGVEGRAALAGGLEKFGGSMGDSATAKLFQSFFGTLKQETDTNIVTKEAEDNILNMDVGKMLEGGEDFPDMPTEKKTSYPFFGATPEERAAQEGRMAGATKTGAITGELDMFGGPRGKEYKDLLAAKKQGGVTVNIDKPTPAGAVEKQAEGMSFLNTLGWLEKNYKPEYVGKITGMDFDSLGNWVKKQTGTLGKDAEEYYATLATLKNTKIKLRSGATVPVTEVPRLMEEIATMWDSDTGYLAKLNVSRRIAADEISSRDKALSAGGYKKTSGAEDTTTTTTINPNPSPEEIQTMSPEEAKKVKLERKRLGYGK